MLDRSRTESEFAQASAQAKANLLARALTYSAGWFGIVLIDIKEFPGKLRSPEEVI